MSHHCTPLMRGKTSIVVVLLCVARPVDTFVFVHENDPTGMSLVYKMFVKAVMCSWECTEVLNLRPHVGGGMHLNAMKLWHDLCECESNSNLGLHLFRK